MDTKNQAQGPFCQSCAMPMNKPEDFGTNADGNRNTEYCHYCYQDGRFVNPNATVQEMIDISTGAMRKMNLPETLIEQTKQYIPMLKRWRAKSTHS
jgi:hypothetical protein